MTKIQWILLLVFLLAAGVAAVITILLRRKRQQNTEKPETMDNLTDFHCHILMPRACGESLPLPIITGAMWKMSRRSFAKS